MSDYLLVVERLMANGADAAMFVSEDTYKGAMFGCVFAEPVHGYVWCDRHGWVLADETCVCGDCVQEAMEAQIVDEFPCGEFDDGQHWREPAQALSPLSPGQWASEPCGDPEWTEEALDAAVAYMDEVEERAWLDTVLEEYGDRGERAVLETDSVATIANVHFEGEGYITVYADMSNGRALTLFRYYEDELCFSSQELVGKTKAQALALFHKKDVAYLHS